VRPRLLLHPQGSAFRPSRQNILHFASIQARRQSDFFVTRTPARLQIPGKRFSESLDKLNPHERFELRAADANTHADIDDRIERCP
jgi:hypothetical protein